VLGVDIFCASDVIQRYTARLIALLTQQAQSFQVGKTTYPEVVAVFCLYFRGNGSSGVCVANPRNIALGNVAVHRRAFELASVEFIDENGGGPGVRFRKGLQKKF
jgi:hypothetical protein